MDPLVADSTSRLIAFEIFFLTVAAHHYGSEAAQSKLGQMRKSIQRTEKDLENFEQERHKYIHVSNFKLYTVATVR